MEEFAAENSTMNPCMCFLSHVVEYNVSLNHQQRLQSTLQQLQGIKKGEHYPSRVLNA